MAIRSEIELRLINYHCAYPWGRLGEPGDSLVLTGNMVDAANAKASLIRYVKKRGWTVDIVECRNRRFEVRRVA